MVCRRWVALVVAIAGGMSSLSSLIRHVDGLLCKERACSPVTRFHVGAGTKGVEGCGNAARPVRGTGLACNFSRTGGVEVRGWEGSERGAESTRKRRRCSRLCPLPVPRMRAVCASSAAAIGCTDAKVAGFALPGAVLSAWTLHISLNSPAK